MKRKLTAEELYKIASAFGSIGTKNPVPKKENDDIYNECIRGTPLEQIFKTNNK